MKYLNLCFLLIAFSALISCNKQEVTNRTELNCEKLTSREEAQYLMSEVIKKEDSTDVAPATNCQQLAFGLQNLSPPPQTMMAPEGS